MVPLMFALLLFVPLGALAQTGSAEPRWIGASNASTREVVFSGTLTLPVRPDRTLLRIAGQQRYRVAINGKGITVGDTAWSETFDLTRFVRLGSNNIQVQVAGSANARPSLAMDLRAWKNGKTVARLFSSPQQMQASGQPAVSLPPPNPDQLQYEPLSILDPEEIGNLPFEALTTLELEGNAQRWPAGKALTVSARIWALSSDVEAATLRVENWSGKTVFSGKAPIHWSGSEGSATFTVPALTRGLYQLEARAGSLHTPQRYAALAVLAEGQTRISSIFDTLSAMSAEQRSLLSPKAGNEQSHIPQPFGLRGIDVRYANNATFFMSVRDLGVNFLQLHIEPYQLDNGELEEFLAFCKAAGFRFALNNETANWGCSIFSAKGVDLFAQSDGCHRWDFAPEILQKATATGLFEGVIYDEAEHMQLSRNAYSKLPDKVHRKPYLVETTGKTLPEAYDDFLSAARRVNQYNRQQGGAMVVESVFPVLWHPLARAGATLCPKLLKEDVHPVVLAMALGAARQYDVPLWFSPDLWYLDKFPGHSVKDFGAALRLAHAVGVDNIYTECINPLCREDGINYQVTLYGQSLAQFNKVYLPSHPRSYTWRDYQPEIAIIRFPDSDWGQASCYYWNTLYGAENLTSTTQTREWLKIWSLLTGGKSHPQAVNANSSVYPRNEWQFALPCPSVAVYDHLVGDAPLQSANTIFLCGVTLSQETRDAVRRRVQAGANCFTTQRFCPQDIQTQVTDRPCQIRDGRGSWIVVQGFRPEHIGHFSTLIPRSDQSMRFRFKTHTVEVPVQGR